MSFESRTIVDFPREEVWRWFSAPGAVTRLTPPFMGMKVVHEATSLRAGTTVLKPALPSPVPSLPLPGWAAEHDPSGYVEGERFVDRATSLPYSLSGWVHEHEFHDADGGTLVLDKVRSRIPDGVLASIFAFRSSRLTADLEALARHREIIGDEPLTIAVTGASGLVGTQLCAWLGTAGHHVVRLVRGRPQPGERRWDPDAPAADLLDGVDVLVHLAGHSIAGRFTDRHKQKVRESRVGPTRKLAERVAERGIDMVCASAVGYYGGNRGDEELVETSSVGDDFLARVVADWEAACEPARAAGCRVVNVRTGIVLSAAGGVLGMLSPVFRMGFGGRLGKGSQWFPWIALDDLVDIYARAIVDDRLEGPVNAAAPQVVRNTDFTRIMGDVLHRATPLPVPGIAPRLLLGREGNDLLATASQRMRPKVLEDLGHVFRFRKLDDALHHELGRERHKVNDEAA